MGEECRWKVLSGGAGKSEADEEALEVAELAAAYGWPPVKCRECGAS